VPLHARPHAAYDAAGGAAGGKSASSLAGNPTACSPTACSPACSPDEDLFDKVRLPSFAQANEGWHSAGGGGGAGGGMAGGDSPQLEPPPSPRAKAPAAPDIDSPTSHIDLPPFTRGAPTPSRDLSDVSRIFFSKNILGS
jgi:hypothetical protein